jgi:hypothetical protein
MHPCTPAEALASAHAWAFAAVLLTIKKAPLSRGFSITSAFSSCRQLSSFSWQLFS